MQNTTTQDNLEPNKSEDTTIYAEPSGLSNAAPEESFPTRLTALRLEKGLKHDSLSELTKLVDAQKRGISRTTLRGYELGETKPGIRELRILSQALGVSGNRLIFGTENIDFLCGKKSPRSDLDKVLGRNQEDFVKLMRFVMFLLNASDQSRDTIYMVASSLASEKLGEVEYRKLIDTARSMVDNFFENHIEIKDNKILIKKESQEMALDMINYFLHGLGFDIADTTKKISDETKK